MAKPITLTKTQHKNKHSKSFKPKKSHSKQPKTKAKKMIRRISKMKGGGAVAPEDFKINPAKYYEVQKGGSSSTTQRTLTTSLLIIVSIALLIVVGFLLYQNFNYHQQSIQMTQQINKELLTEAKYLKKHLENRPPNYPHNEQNYNDWNAVRNIHAQRIINPLLPPERSYENTYGIPINTPTRGFVGGYQQIGMLYKTDITNEDTSVGNNNKSVILPLFGKPTFPGSNHWNYYTTNDKMNMVKMPFHVNGKLSDDRFGVREIQDGDTLQLPPYNGDFKVNLYQFDKPTYIPYVF